MVFKSWCYGVFKGENYWLWRTFYMGCLYVSLASSQQIQVVPSVEDKNVL